MHLPSVSIFFGINVILFFEITFSTGAHPTAFYRQWCTLSCLRVTRSASYVSKNIAIVLLRWSPSQQLSSRFCLETFLTITKLSLKVRIQTKMISHWPCSCGVWFKQWKGEFPWSPSLAHWPCRGRPPSLSYLCTVTKVPKVREASWSRDDGPSPIPTPAPRVMVTHLLEVAELALTPK